MTFTQRFRNLFSVFMLYAMEILHPMEIRTDRMITAREFKQIK